MGSELLHIGPKRSLAQCSWQDVADFLAKPEAFGVERAPGLIETHISRLYVLDQLVYKLKKPVKFDFLDYTSVSARRRACEDEVSLNQRLAAAIYLGVVVVTCEADGHLALDGAGAPVDYLVKMRRMPQELMLDELIKDKAVSQPGNSQISSAALTALSQVLCDFYRRLRPVDITPEAFIEHMTAHVQANRSELLRVEHGLASVVIKRLHGRQLQFIQLERTLLAQRVRDGRVVDGHGDLRPEHICMAMPPVIFDCVEFSQELRQIDALDELSFLSMECQRLGVPEIGDDIISRYQRQNNDPAPPRLIEFYKSYRACVRAKVAAIRSTQLYGPESAKARRLTEAYLQIADRDLGWSSIPICLLVRGRTGSGKSTLAGSLVAKLGADWLQTDQIRRLMEVEDNDTNGYGEGRYAATQRYAVYEHLYEQASVSLAAGLSVVLDACFLTHDLQNQVLARTRAVGVPLFIVNCQCPMPVATSRIIARLRDPNAISEAKPEHFVQQSREDEGALPGVPTIMIDTEKGTTSEHVLAVFAQLAEHLFTQR
jgi:aminoglycoside phosphotransferase family enzyme/predicted kinase